MKLSLILPVVNDAATIVQQLDAIAAQAWSGQWELIVADNGSTDQTLDIARSYGDRISNLRIIDATQRRGPAHARNEGVKVAQGETVAFIDADDVIGEGWMAAIAEAAEKHDFIASRFDYRKLREQPEQDYCGGTQVKGIQRMWWSPFYPHSGGGGIAIKRELHEAIGGFDTSWLRLQDTDYCIRLYKHGARLRFASDAVIHIRNRATYKGIFKQAKSWGQYNALLYKRYRNESEKLPHPIRSFCRDGLRALKRAVRGPRTPGVIYQLGWHVGLLKGSLMYRVAPPVTGLTTIPDEVPEPDEPVPSPSS